MIRTATIIPTHTPKFDWAYKLLDSYIQYVQQPHDLYFVFTNENEAHDFKDKCKSPNAYKELVLPISLRDKKSIINVKKYFALYSIHTQYDYVGVFDSESIFVKHCDLNNVYSDIVSVDYFKSNIAKDGIRIIQNIAEKLKLNYNKNLILETDFYSLYWWFNEIPVYRMDYFSEFINWFYSLDNINEIQNDYYCFDFLVYSIWLICFKGFKLKKYETPIKFGCGALEEFRVRPEIKDIITETFDSYWDTNLNSHINYNKIKLIFQIDGVEEINQRKQYIN